MLYLPNHSISGCFCRTGNRRWFLSSTKIAIKVIIELFAVKFFRYGVAETARTTTKTAPEPLCEKSGRMISPIYIIGIGRRPDFRRARNAVRGDSRRPDMPGLRRRQEQFRRGRGAARKARRSPEKERPAAFRRAVSKKSGGGYITFADFCYFCPSRTVRGQESNQYNDEKNPIPDGCNGHDVGV